MNYEKGITSKLVQDAFFDKKDNAHKKSFMVNPCLTEEQYKQYVLGKIADLEAQVAEAERKGIHIEESKLIRLKDELYEKLSRIQ